MPPTLVLAEARKSLTVRSFLGEVKGGTFIDANPLRIVNVLTMAAI